MNEKILFALLAILTILVSLVILLQVAMLSKLVGAESLTATVTEYNDGGAGGKFSSDVPMEDQILRAECDRLMTQQYE